MLPVNRYIAYVSYRDSIVMNKHRDYVLRYKVANF